MNSALDCALGAVMTIGFIGAVIALVGRYRALPAFLTGPNICRLKDNGCEVLFRSKNAALLGVPNSALAVLYYPFLALGIVLHWPFPLLLAAATAAFLMTLVLAHILLRDRLECRVCWTGHICNSLIWLVLLFQYLYK